VYGRMMEVLKGMRALREMKEEDIPQNYSYCMSFFRPCAYWSNCFSRTFTDAADQYDIYDSTDMPVVLGKQQDNNDLDIFN